MGNGRAKRSQRKRVVPSLGPRSRVVTPWALFLVVALACAVGAIAGRFRYQSASVDPPSPARIPVDSARSAVAPIAPYTPPPTFEQLRRESFQVVNELLERFPDDPEVFAKAAQLAGVFGEKELAHAYWVHCVELAPQSMPARYALTMSALRDGRYEEVARHSRGALALDPNSIAFRNLLGCALVELGKPKQARDLLQASVRQGVAHRAEANAYCDTYTLLGKACLLERDYEQAAEYYAEAVRLDPNWSKALYGLGTACARIGKTEEAKASLERFRRTQSTEVVMSHEEQLAAARHDVAIIYRTVASIYARYGDRPTSQRLLSWSSQLDPDPAENPAATAVPSHLEGRVSDAGD